MQRNRLFAILVIFCIGMAQFVAGPMVRSSEAQTPPRQTQAASGKDTATNDLQRSAEIYSYKVLGKSGAARGEVIYYYKCWVCHNEYTKGAPYLKDLYKHAKLVSGEPVNDDTVSKQIKNGSPKMPSFRTSLSDSDVADVLSYIREGKCCFEETNPPANPWYRESAQKSAADGQSRKNLSGGARGVVRSASGEPLEGIMVQLIAPNAVRTTVYSNEEGSYEFPQLQAGIYTLRIAKPLEFLPYQRNSVRIDRSTKLEDIVLERRSDSEYLPPTTEVYAQLSGAEWLWNLSGTAQEKRTFNDTCGNGCHSYQQIFRNRYDERSWRLMVERMTHYSGSPLINRSPQQRGSSEEEERVVKWLATVRGPDSKDVPLRVFPGPRGLATRVIVTEYELPHALIAPHDVSGDSKGNIWYSSHRTPYMGKLDPSTGNIKEYPVPPTPPDILPGTHRIQVDKNDVVWLTENWAHNLVRFDPSTEKFTKVKLPTEAPLNSPGNGNIAVAPDGYIWMAREGAVKKIDPETGQVVQRYPLTKITSTYDNLITRDGNFWAGGSPAEAGNTMELLDIRTGKMSEVETVSRRSTAARGGFDPEGNAWFGGRGGALLELEAKTRRAREFAPPTPYSAFYEAMPDKNGEVWAGDLHGGRFLRFNPRTERWIEYVMPEPYSHDRRTWIDNSTDPVTVWYVDHHGYLVRIQPLE